MYFGASQCGVDIARAFILPATSLETNPEHAGIVRQNAPNMIYLGAMMIIFLEVNYGELGAKF